MAERKNYKRIRLAKHLETALAKRFPGQKIEVNPNDFGYPLGSQRTDWRQDILRWDIFCKVGDRTVECNSDYTMTDCAKAPGVFFGEQWDGFHLDTYPDTKPKSACPRGRTENG